MFFVGTLTVYGELEKQKSVFYDFAVPEHPHFAKTS
jgi:hypothetical protein